MGRKRGEDRRVVTFRMPTGHYEIIENLAQARGTDVSAVLNQVIAENIQGLRRQLELLLGTRQWVFVAMPDGTRASVTLHGVWDQSAVELITTLTESHAQDGESLLHESGLRAGKIVEEAMRLQASKTGRIVPKDDAELTKDSIEATLLGWANFASRPKHQDAEEWEVKPATRAFGRIPRER